MKISKHCKICSKKMKEFFIRDKKLQISIEEILALIKNKQCLLKERLFCLTIIIILSFFINVQVLPAYTETHDVNYFEIRVCPDLFTISA